jgi:hypothetical protein
VLRVSAEQLSFLEPARPTDSRVISDRVLTNEEAGLAASVPDDGRAKLLAALVKRGLAHEHLHEVARFIRSWDRHAPLEEPREELEAA